MLLMQVPLDIHLSIIEIGDFSINDLKSLSFTCRHFAYPCLSEIWKTRKFIENDSLTTFRNTLSNNPLMPYGDFIFKLQIDELEKEPPITIDSELIKFFAEKCKNLKELMLRFSQKKRKNRAHLLPLKLLGDRLINLSIVTYEHLDQYDDDDAQVKQENKGTKITEFSSLVNDGRQILKRMYNYYGGKGTKEISKLNEGSKSHEINFHDALSETVKLGNVKSIRLYFPKMSEQTWESFTSSAANSLQAIRITLNSPTMIVPDPSLVVSLFAKYCKNLRIFDIDIISPSISKKSTMLMLENCKKLEYLDISASSETVPYLYKSQSIKSLYLSYPVNGSDLNQINERMENLTKLSFLRIEGKSNFSFLKNFPNLEYLSIGDFGEMDDEGFLNVSKSNITGLRLARTPKISDEALRMLGSMQSLVKFNIRARLPNVTQEGWINLVRRPTSWRIIAIDDGRQINAEFFEILDDHRDLESLRIRGFSYDDKLLKDDSFNNLKFKEAWNYYRNHSSIPVMHWPIRYPNVRKKFILKKDKDIYSTFKQEDAYEGSIQKQPDVGALKEAATALQREEQKATGGDTPAGGAASKAQSFADRVVNETYQRPNEKPSNNISLGNVDTKTVRDAARILQREEAKLCGGETPVGGAGSLAQSLADKASQTQESGQ